MRWARRLWPRTLFGQLMLIMVGGTLAIQLMSSSIWFDVRFAQVFEAPVRLIAARSAPLIQQASCHAGVLKVPAHYQLRCAEQLPVLQQDERRGRKRVELLLHQALKYELGHEPQVRLMKVQLTDELGQPIVWRSLFGLRTAQAHLQFAVPLADGHWLTIDGQELQGWSGESAWLLISDYLLRVYALRIVAVLVVCLIAVRLCLRPLRRLADAALALGMRPPQIFCHIVLPQAMRVIIPPTANQFISMLKDSSLISVMGVWEIMFLAQSYGRSSYRYLEMLTTAAVIYWVLSIALELVQARLERHYGKAYQR